MDLRVGAAVNIAQARPKAYNTPSHTNRKPETLTTDYTEVNGLLVHIYVICHF